MSDGKSEKLIHRGYRRALLVYCTLVSGVVTASYITVIATGIGSGPPVQMIPLAVMMYSLAVVWVIVVVDADRWSDSDGR